MKDRTLAKRLLNEAHSGGFTKLIVAIELLLFSFNYYYLDTFDKSSPIYLLFFSGVLIIGATSIRLRQQLGYGKVDLKNTKLLKVASEALGAKFYFLLFAILALCAFIIPLEYGAESNQWVNSDCRSGECITTSTWDLSQETEAYGEIRPILLTMAFTFIWGIMWSINKRSIYLLLIVLNWIVIAAAMYTSELNTLQVSALLMLTNAVLVGVSGARDLYKFVSKR
jgi:hypothetical protein